MPIKRHFTKTRSFRKGEQTNRYDVSLPQKKPARQKTIGEKVRILPIEDMAECQQATSGKTAIAIFRLFCLIYAICMYVTFFGLKRRPFLFVPDVEAYFSAESMEESRRDIERTIQNGEGISLVFGASGTGKTLLTQILRHSLEAEYTVALVSNSRLETPKALFLQLAHDLHITPAHCVETVELRLQLLDFARKESPQGVVLLFDDAQYLHPSVLEEIRFLTDSADGSPPLFRVVLAGTLDFEEKLTLPSLETFNQRIASRCYLDSFSGEETSQYIVRQTDGHRIDPPHCVSASLFTDEATRRIFQLTDGVPRLINQLCGTALQFAAERTVPCVDGALVNDAWASFQQIEAEDKTGSTHTDVVQESVISPKQIEEIIDRKKNTFQLRQFNPVEFGTLTDSDSVETESVDTHRSFHENEYKPPYPEDDEDECSEDEEVELQVYRLPGVPDKTSHAESAIDHVREVIVSKRQLVPGNLNRQHHKFRRRYLVQKIRYRLGLFAGVLRKHESQPSDIHAQESSMNEQSLQEYGAAVLEGRPPFVRKEPHYAYQTTEVPTRNNVTYPDPKTGIPITLRWLSEKKENTERFGVSYTEFLNREASPKSESPEKKETQNVMPEVPTEPVAAQVIRTSLNASQNHPVASLYQSALEESFEESEQVGEWAISLAELFRVDSKQIEESPEFKSLDESVQRQLAAVIQRITKAAEKIEQAAEASERAGRHVSQAAEYVETEVRSALPTYTDLFRQWSEFQKLISEELELARCREPEPQRLQTFPRRQVMIERTVPTIDVESLLR
jgi:type II secretory pathway predicted ATPase ExeA